MSAGEETGKKVVIKKMTHVWHLTRSVHSWSTHSLIPMDVDAVREKRERWLEGTDGVHLPISKALLRGSVHPIGVLEFTKRKWMGGLSH